MLFTLSWAVSQSAGFYYVSKDKGKFQKTDLNILELTCVFYCVLLLWETLPTNFSKTPVTNFVINFLGNSSIVLQPTCACEEKKGVCCIIWLTEPTTYISQVTAFKGENEKWQKAKRLLTENCRWMIIYLFFQLQYQQCKTEQTGNHSSASIHQYSHQKKSLSQK